MISIKALTSYKLLTATLLTVAISLSQGCAVIHFENGEVTPDPEPAFYDFISDAPEQLDASSSKRYRQWYHHSIYQFAELSNALETSEVCIGLDWNQVTTEVTPWGVVIGLLDNALFYKASAMGIDLWSHWSIEYSCRNTLVE